MPADNATKVYLTNSTQYVEWLTALETQARASHVWHLFDPTSNSAQQEKPIPPKLPNLRQFVNDGDPIPTGPHVLTGTNKTAWNQQVEYYKLLSDQYRMEESAYRTESLGIQKVVTYMQETMSSHIFSTCCLPEKTYNNWVKLIASRVGIDNKEAKLRARLEYQRVLGGAKKSSRWDIWLSEYDRATMAAERQNCAELSDEATVIYDFVQSIKKFDEMYAIAFGQAVVNNPSISRQEAMRQFRLHMESHHPVKQKAHHAFMATNEPIPHAEGDAFHATAGAQSQSQGGGSAQSNPQGGGTTRPIQRSKERQNGPRGRRSAPAGSQGRSMTPAKRLNNQGEQRLSRCPACDQQHKLSDCYYAFPDKAPTWWEPNEFKKGYVQYRLENDTQLQGLVRGSSRSRTRTPVMKASRTPTPRVEESDD
jgi:hypothetical protein